MDSSCWTDVSLNKNRGWRWREGGILLAGLMSLSSRIKGWIEVDLRMRFLIESLNLMDDGNDVIDSLNLCTELV